MKEQITLDMINNFSNTYNSNSFNRIIENAITENGLEKSCIDKRIIEENQPVFNIELPDGKRYDQKDNYRCWIYCGLNTIQYDMAKNLNIDLKKFALSNNYIAFFDKLEKSNNVYQNIINIQNTDWEYVDKEDILQYCVNEGGHWQWFVSIVNKYGLMPYEYMPDVFESLRMQNITGLFNDKVKKDCIKLLNAKRENTNIDDLRKMKETFLEENYIFLSKILGEPKMKFDYEYKDKESNYVKYENMTPIEFRDKFLSINLNDFVSLGNIPMYNKEYYKLYREKYLGNVYQGSYVEFLNLPINEIKELVIKQLKDNMPVYIRINLRKFRDKKSGVLDTRLFNYKNTFGFDFLTKEDALNTHDIYPHHCMSICGVNLLENNKPQRWKLEDSYGTEEKVDGYYIMNDNYFDEFILQAIINKKYLSEEEYDNLKTESAKLVKEGKPRQMLNFSLNGNGKISAGTYYYDFLPNTETDFIRYREGVNSKSKELNNIKVPVLVVFGDMDECVLTQDIEIVKEYLKNNIKECNIQIIKGADYSFSDKYEELGEVINNNI